MKGLSARSAGRATFRNAVHGEWTKLRSLPSTGYTLVVTAALGVGFGALFSLAAARRYPEATPAELAAFDPTANSLQSHVVAQLAVIVLAVLVISSEYSTGMIRTSLAAVPRRARLLAAKATVFGAIALVVGAVVGLGAFLAGQAVLAARGAPHAALSQPGVVRAVLGTGLYLAMIGLLGVAVGTLLRATAGGITAMVALTLLVPAFSQLLPASWAANVEKYWPSFAGGRIMSVRPDPAALPPWTGFGVLAAVTVIVLAAAFVVLQRRDA